MKLRKGQARYRIPPHSQVLNVRVEGNQRHNQMCSFILYRVDLEELGPLDQEPGMPRKFAILHDIIEFSPPPDKPYIVKGMCTPPVMEF